MRIIIFIIGIVVLTSSCTKPKNLTKVEYVDINTYGSYIGVYRTTESNVYGELIAIDQEKMIVLLEDTAQCVTVPLSDVTQFTLRYAEPDHYAWSIPAYTFMTITHGLWLLVTAPVNLIVTIAVTASGERAYRYNNRNMTFEELTMFARFPQGIPPNVDLSEIH